MIVLTAGEGHWLGPMIAGHVQRYTTADVPPPEVLYVDRVCCGDQNLCRMFGVWPNLHYRLNIWHFIRRFVCAPPTLTSYTASSWVVYRLASSSADLTISMPLLKPSVQSFVQEQFPILPLEISSAALRNKNWLNTAAGQREVLRRQRLWSNRFWHRYLVEAVRILWVCPSWQMRKWRCLSLDLLDVPPAWNRFICTLPDLYQSGLLPSLHFLCKCGCKNPSMMRLCLTCSC